MRIIAGKFKGRIVKMPKSDLVRPTTDKNKESIFNFLSNQIDFNKIIACDLYAGSGGLGLEALSRGASSIHFVENNFQVYSNLKENIKSLGAESNCKVFKSSALKFSKREDHLAYDLILLDPPFFKFDIHNVYANLLENKFIGSGGLMLIERSIQTRDKDIEAFGIEPFRRLGDSLIYLIKT